MEPRGIDSEESILLASVAQRAGKTNRVVIPARQAGNRFLGSLNGPQIRAQIRVSIIGVLYPTTTSSSVAPSFPPTPLLSGLDKANHQKDMLQSYRDKRIELRNE
jgi:hypothetical protein